MTLTKEYIIDVAASGSALNHLSRSEIDFLRTYKTAIQMSEADPEDIELSAAKETLETRFHRRLSGKTMFALWNHEMVSIGTPYINTCHGKPALFVASSVELKEMIEESMVKKQRSRSAYDQRRFPRPKFQKFTSKEKRGVIYSAYQFGAENVVLNPNTDVEFVLSLRDFVKNSPRSIPAYNKNHNLIQQLMIYRENHGRPFCDDFFDEGDYCRDPLIMQLLKTNLDQDVFVPIDWNGNPMKLPYSQSSETVYAAFLIDRIPEWLEERMLKKTDGCADYMKNRTMALMDFIPLVTEEIPIVLEPNVLDIAITKQIVLDNRLSPRPLH